MAGNVQIEVSTETIAEFCRRHHIRKLSLFGSVLRDDFRPDSDVDVLVEFEADVRYSLFDFVDMHDELAFLLGRQVNLVDVRTLRNPFRRYEILRTQEVIYAT